MNNSNSIIPISRSIISPCCCILANIGLIIIRITPGNVHLPLLFISKSLDCRLFLGFQTLANYGCGWLTGWLCLCALWLKSTFPRFFANNHPKYNFFSSKTNWRDQLRLFCQNSCFNSVYCFVSLSGERTSDSPPSLSSPIWGVSCGVSVWLGTFSERVLFNFNYRKPLKVFTVETWSSEDSFWLLRVLPALLSTFSSSSEHEQQYNNYDSKAILYD